MAIKLEDTTLRRWYFELEDFDDNVGYLDASGGSIDYSNAQDNPFIGTCYEARAEADRRSDLWEEKNDCCASRITYHSMGKVREEKGD